MKTFKIGFMLKDKSLLYYGYNKKFPYLTRNIEHAYKFKNKIYPTKEDKLKEANNLKKYFFNECKILTVLFK